MLLCHSRSHSHLFISEFLTLSGLGVSIYNA